MNSQNTKVLIIEDEEVLLEVLQGKFKKEGYLVEAARDGAEGLIKVRSFRPDIILLDMIMPKLDGFQFLEKMQQDEAVKNIPVVIISNSGQPVEIERALKLGVKDYIIKTEFDPQEVLDKMNKILNSSQTEQDKANLSSSSKISGPVVVDNTEKPAVVSPGREEQQNSSALDKEKACILIVEDDKFLRDLLVHKLEEKDYQTEVAIDGEEGYQKINQLKPDLVLLDLILPGVDGFEVLKKVHENSELVQIPIIILSNLGQQEEIEKGLSLGAKDYLIKAHFTPEEVVARIKKVLGK